MTDIRPDGARWLRESPAGHHPVMEFAQSMPDDDLTVADGARLDPLTCELTTAYVSAIAN